ncbi:MAG: hypothetical protein KF845_16270 [Cyclobacteriaceae bacterium]|nr:hypothetical protein [Cyclobacteriaceae bacterium]
MKNITKRDVKIFILGMLTMIMIEFITDWSSHVQAAKRGFNDGFNERKD